MKTLKIVFVFLMVQLSFGQTSLQKVDSIISSLHAEGRFNGTILIAEKGKISYLKSLGLANEDTNEKLDKNSIFDLASISKQFTAMGIMILKEKGKLRLDDALSLHIPELSAYKDITVQDLLHHTSGMPDYMKVLSPLVDKTQSIVNDDVIALYSKHHPELEFTPGTKYEYSNTGYVFLASIIERASGMRYKKFLKKFIFKPLNMNRSFVYTPDMSLNNVTNYAYGYLYSREDNKFVLPHKIERARQLFGWVAAYGDGSVNSTVMDLLKWDRALYTNKLISKESFKEMFSPSYKDGKLLKNYGFGWSLKENKIIGKYVRHSGGWPGYVTEIERHVDTDKTIIVLQNHYGTERPIKWIRNVLYGEEIPKSMFQLFEEGKSIDAIVAFSQNPETAHLVDGFHESGLNNFGYQLIRTKNNDAGLKVLKLNVSLHPESANALDSLGECLLFLGKEREKEGILAYEKSLELNPKNTKVTTILQELSKTGK